MTDNLYAPPQADMSRAPVGAGSDDSFYVVSQRKFVLMFILTFSIYQIYWFYKNWANYKRQCQLNNWADSDLWPVARAIFAVFFIHNLFRKVNQHAVLNQRPLSWEVESHATTLVVLTVIANVNGLLFAGLLGQVLSTLIGLGLMGGIGFSLHKAQAFINNACGDAKGAANSQLTPANFVWMAIGVMVWIFTIIGLFATKAPLPA